MPVHHILFGFLVSIAWGVNFVAMKIGLNHLSPFLFIALRFAIVLMLMAPWLRVMQGKMWLLLWIGLCLGGVHFAFAIMGLQLAENITSIVVIVQMHVPITLIMAHIFLQERLSYWRGSGIVIAFMGVLLITFDPAIANERLAILVIFGATLFYSTGSVLLRRLKDVGVFNTQAWTAVFGLPILLSLTFMTEADQMTQLMAMNQEGWMAVFYTAVVSSIIGYGGMNFLVKRHPVTLIAPIFLSVPIFATMAAVIAFDEILTPRFLMGASLTLLGLAVIHLRDWWKKRQLVEELLP
ncbi:DMT family transporter [Paremcibacter congregatus]|uniref:DMT family transporter n=1 Tax=Paremcibacter congregatus TaxID=2043170 RepID=UPI0030EDD290|tara:strand:- start:5246 stop:6130 length:885 start_codon:yes stop_codon:yes gene_type:complete